MLKEDVVMKYINELYKKYVFVPIDKAVNNTAKFFKKHNVTVILK